MARAHWVYFELFTGDLPGATAFYAALAGWTPQPSTDPAYVTLNAGPETAAGLVAPRVAGAASQWVAYLTVDDLDASTAAIVAQGGTVVVPASDLPGVGRTAGVADPFGGTFFLFQPQGVEGGGKPFPWMELFVDDPAAAAAWYASALGLTVGEMPFPGGAVALLKDGERPIAGVRARPSWPLPNAWVPVARVVDLDAALAHAAPLEAPLDLPGIGRFAYVADPGGAVIELLQEA